MARSASLIRSDSTDSLARPVEPNSSQKRWDRAYRVGIAVAAALVLIGAATLIIANFVSVSSLPFDLTMLGIIVAAGGVTIGVVTLLFKGADWRAHRSLHRKDEEERTEYSVDSDVEKISDVSDTLTDSSESDDKAIFSESSEEEASGEYMYTPATVSSEPKDGPLRTDSFSRTMPENPLIFDTTPAEALDALVHEAEKRAGGLLHK